MANKKLSEMVGLILEKTREQKLKWQRTYVNEMFFCFVDLKDEDKIRLTINAYKVDNAIWYSLLAENDNPRKGLIDDYHSETDKLLKKLYREVREKVTEKKLQELLEILDKI